MTVECADLMKDFGLDDYKIVEYMLTRASPMRIASAIKKYGKGQKHSADWYLPLFKNGYIKSDYAFDCSFDENFWKAYHSITAIRLVRNITLRSVYLLGIVVRVKLIINCTVVFQHTRL